MILQAAALAALFVDQTSTNQLVLQCMQKVEPESLGEMVTANDCADNSQPSLDCSRSINRVAVISCHEREGSP